MENVITLSTQGNILMVLTLKYNQSKYNMWNSLKHTYVDNF